MADQDFLQTARERYDFGRTADADDRREAEADNAFANADNTDLAQWDDAAKKARRRRPILQWNRIPTYVQQVVNDGRQNKPSIQIAPQDGGTPETAEYFQARIRHIEYESNADTAKDTARDQQVTSGRGFIRVTTENIPGTITPEGKHKQRIRIDRIENQFSVVFDPAAVEYDRSDADWCFVISQISKDAHLRKYGKDSLVNRLDFADAIKLAPEWIGLGENAEMIQVAEYWWKEYRDRTRVLLGSTGLPAWKDEIAEQYDELKAKGLIVAELTEKSPTVWQYVINGAEVLSKTEWIGSTIPIIPVWGREATVDGKRRTYSLVRNAIGPQKLLNLYVSNAAELIGQMPKSPHMVPVEGIPAGAENDWKRINSEALAYLLYNAYDSQGRPLQPPNRITAEPPIQALAIGINQCIDGIKASMGIYDASIGAQSNETSGVAIERRRKQSNITNYHFPDNESRSNKYLGEILIELIPLIDQPGSTNPIRTEDGKTHLVPIGQPHKDWKTGATVVHDLRSGQYGVTVSTGPSYVSQRQEAYDRDAALVQAQPELMWAIGPQMFRSDDTAGSEERAEALERYINLKMPGLIPQKDKQGQKIPPEVQQQMAGMQQQLQKTQAFAQSLHEQIQTKQPELQNAVRLKQMEIDFQREKLQVDSQTKIDVAALAQGISADIAHLQAAIEVLMHERGIKAQQDSQQATQAHAVGMAGMQQGHAAEMADKQHQQAMESQEQAAALQPQPEETEE